MGFKPISIGSEGIVDTLGRMFGLIDGVKHSAVFTGPHVVWNPEGAKHPIETISQVTLTERFLGIPGKTVRIYVSGVGAIEVPRVPDEAAKLFKSEVDAELYRVKVVKAKELLKKHSNDCEKALKDFWRNEYLSQYALEQWMGKYGVLAFLKYIEEEFIREHSSSPDAVISCKRIFSDPPGVKKWRNDVWIEKALPALEAQFKKILPASKPLTLDQKIAILTNDNRVLAVAGAGTGKTTTAVGKVAYILQQKYCKPDEILLMTYAKGMADELSSRVREVCGDGIEVRTFHSLGKKILDQVAGAKQSLTVLSEQGEYLRERLSRYLQELEKDRKGKLALMSFLIYHHYPPASRLQYESEGEYVRAIAKHGLTTLRGEVVKSTQEAIIANWLYLHGLNYKYEWPYEHSVRTNERRDYKPDFYLLDYGIYIEHFGVDKDGATASWVNPVKYHMEIKWKRELHKTHRTKLVETYSWQEWDGTLVDHLGAELKHMGVVLKSSPHEKILNDKEYADRKDALIQLLGTFLNLYKSAQDELPGIRSVAATRRYDATRCRAFLDIFEHVLVQYESDLKSERAIDFGDMIRNAVGHVVSGRYKSPFKVIIIDEFQDIAKGRAELMEALLQQTPDARLFCVGDDWQSIYRFAGSDVQLMTNFEKSSTDAVRVDLTKTFRFNDRILGASSHFITRNHNQLKKDLKPALSLHHPAIHVIDEETGIQGSLASISSMHKGADGKPSVFILTRYGHQFTKAKLTKLQQDYPHLELKAMTIHKSKGQEADYVVILGMTSGDTYSFPSEMGDDPILNLLLSEKEPFRNAEERRLLYVALTRAKKEVWLCCPPRSYSSFIQELLDDPEYQSNGWVSVEKSSLKSAQRCSICGGILQQREKNGSKFFGCSNYPYCKHTSTIESCPYCHTGTPVLDASSKRFVCSAGCGWYAHQCARCGDSWMIKIPGRYGAFWTCASYKKTKCKGGFFSH